jgi:hypothetical protein
MFVPFTAILVCSLVLLPLFSKVKKTELCSFDHKSLLTNTQSGLSENDAKAVSSYSVFTYIFNILTAVAVIVFTFTYYIKSIAIINSEFIPISMTSVILVSLIFMFALAILMLASSRHSRYKVLDLNNFIKAEYMNRNQVVKTKG